MATTFTSNEYPCYKSLSTLISKWDTLALTPDQRKPIKYQGKEYPLLPLLKKYKKAYKDGKVPINYEYSAKHAIPGRQFSKGTPSLQGLKRWIRHTLSRGYHDYDMVNCHPTIFTQYCEKKDWDVIQFKSYLENRDTYLAELMIKNDMCRDDAKEVVLALLNGGNKNYDSLEHKPVWLINLKNTISTIHDKILTEPENEELVKKVRENKKRNIGGSVMNNILCNIENDILMKAIDFLNVEEPVLIFDGFQGKIQYTSDQLLNLQDHVLSETGYDLKWIEKSMDEGIDLSPYQVDEDKDEETDDKLTDNKAFDIVMEKHAEIIKRNHDQITIFNKKTGLWSSTNDETLGAWYIICAETFGEDEKYGHSIKLRRDLFQLTKTIENSSEFFKKATKNRLGKLLYSNYIWDFENNCSLDFSPEYYFTKKIERNHVEKDQVNFDRVKRILFDNPHPEKNVRNEFIKAVSVAMCGYNPERGFLNCIGKTKCGKSTTINHFKRSFGSFVACINLGVFMVSKHTKGNDHNGPLLNFKDSRIVFCSEQDGICNSEIIKQYSGGDEVNARECGLKSESFYVEATMIAMSNFPIQFDKKGEALKERNKCIKWEVQFATKSQASQAAIDDMVWLETSQEAMEAMDHIIQWGWNLYKKEGFKKVDSMIQFTEEINDEEDKFTEIFDKYYELSSQNDSIPTTEVYPKFREFSTKEYEIKERFKDIGVNWARITVNNSKKTSFKGLKRKSQVMDDGV